MTTASLRFGGQSSSQNDNELSTGSGRDTYSRLSSDLEAGSESSTQS